MDIEVTTTMDTEKRSRTETEDSERMDTTKKSRIEAEEKGSVDNEDDNPEGEGSSTTTEVKQKVSLFTQLQNIGKAYFIAVLYCNASDRFYSAVRQTPYKPFTQ